MADQNITALPVATTPESSDRILLVGATEEKLINYDELADAILRKIASKNFALDQGNKTLLAALNELNSKWTKEYDWRSYDDIMTAINSEKEVTLAQGLHIFWAATSGGHPYMVVLCVPEARDAIGIYADYFNTAISIIRYKDGSFEKISKE